MPVLSRARGGDAARGRTRRRRRPERPRLAWFERSRTSTPSSRRTRSWCSRPTTTARSPTSTTPRRPRSSTILRDRVHTHLDAGPRVRRRDHQPPATAAGASIAHPHAQVFALDVVPRAVERGAGARSRRGHRPRAGRRAPPTELVVVAGAAGDHVVPARVDLAVPVPHRARRRRPTLRPRRTTTCSTRSRSRCATPARRLRAVARRRALQHGDPHRTPRPANRSTGTSRSSRACRCTAGFEQATGILVNTVATRSRRPSTLRAAIA